MRKQSSVPFTLTKFLFPFLNDFRNENLYESYGIKAGFIEGIR